MKILHIANTLNIVARNHEVNGEKNIVKSRRSEVFDDIRVEWI